MSLGRLEEAVVPRKTSLDLHHELKNSSEAACDARNLADLFLALGKLCESEKATRLAIEYDLSSGDIKSKMISYARLATVLHRLGQLEPAQEIFAQAEELQQQVNSEHPYLWSLRGAWYCAFLLEIAKDSDNFNQVLKRAEYIFLLDKTKQPLLDKAYYNLTKARTYQSLQQPIEAADAFNIAVQTIQKAGKIQYMPEFYLARAKFCICQNDLLKAEADIKTANHTINRCGMKLYAVDAALLQAHFCLAKNDPITAKAHAEQAEMLIAKTGYHLRDKALAELKQNLKN